MYSSSFQCWCVGKYPEHDGLYRLSLILGSELRRNCLDKLSAVLFWWEEIPAEVDSFPPRLGMSTLNFWLFQVLYGNYTIEILDTKQNILKLRTSEGCVRFSVVVFLSARKMQQGKKLADS